ncbi:hypothetical protein P7K49_031308, partial [Saguinus oedipus]
DLQFINTTEGRVAWVDLAPKAEVVTGLVRGACVHKPRGLPMASTSEQVSRRAGKKDTFAEEQVTWSSVKLTWQGDGDLPNDLQSFVTDARKYLDSNETSTYG